MRAKMVREDVTYYVKICQKLAHPVENGEFQSIFARSASAITLSEKFEYHYYPLPAFQ